MLYDNQIPGKSYDRANLGMGANQAAPSSEPGVLSTLQELAQEIRENSNLAENFRSTLGIATPAPGEKATTEPQNLRDLLRMCVYQARKANSDFADCLRHINS